MPDTGYDNACQHENIVQFTVASPMRTFSFECLGKNSLAIWFSIITDSSSSFGRPPLEYSVIKYPVVACSTPKRRPLMDRRPLELRGANMSSEWRQGEVRVRSIGGDGGDQVTFLLNTWCAKEPLVTWCEAGPYYIGVRWPG